MTLHRSHRHPHHLRRPSFSSSASPSMPSTSLACPVRDRQARRPHLDRRGSCGIQRLANGVRALRIAQSFPILGRSEWRFDAFISGELIASKLPAVTNKSSSSTALKRIADVELPKLADDNDPGIFTSVMRFDPSFRNLHQPQTLALSETI
jgi:hypothetical protein